MINCSINSDGNLSEQEQYKIYKNVYHGKVNEEKNELIQGKTSRNMTFFIPFQCQILKLWRKNVKSE